jgi:hypothetical protein
METTVSKNTPLLQQRLLIRCQETGCVIQFYYCCVRYLATAAAYKVTA